MRAILVILCVLLAACASDLERLSHLAQADLQRAIEINIVANDADGLQCGEGLLEIVKEVQAREVLPQPVGIASGVAYARALRLIHEDSTLLTRINRACAPMFVESTYTYSRLLMRLGLAP